MFWFSVGCYVVDQGSGDGWFFGRFKILVINCRKEFSKFRDAGREDCFFFEQDHTEFPIQEEGQSRGTESSQRRPVSARKTDRFMIYDYFRVTGAHDTVLDYADLFSVTLHDDNIQEFDTRWDDVLLSSVKNCIRWCLWKVCTNW